MCERRLSASNRNSPIPPGRVHIRQLQWQHKLQNQSSTTVTKNHLVLLTDAWYIEFIAFAPGTTLEQQRGYKLGKYADRKVVD